MRRTQTNETFLEKLGRVGVRGKKTLPSTPTQRFGLLSVLERQLRTNYESSTRM